MTQLATKSLHQAYDASGSKGSQAVPIYQTSSYVFENTDDAAEKFALKKSGYIYSRLNNPTVEVLENRLASIEGGNSAVCFSSGTAAIATTLLNLLRTGDHLIASTNLYGGTFNLLNVTLNNFGITCSFVDVNNPEEIKRNIQNNTKLVFVESLSNPSLEIADISSISEICNENNLPLIVDNTIPSPALLKPIEHGAHIVIHSLTKYIGGQGNTLGGIVIEGDFDWSKGDFPALQSPSKSYHGLVYTEQFPDCPLSAKLRLEGLRDFGAALSPFSAFQILQGLETLSLRMEKHSSNALELAKWLKEQKEVAWVKYPGLEQEINPLVDKYFPNKQSGLLSIGLKGGYEKAKALADSLELFALLANIGDTKSLVIHPASTTHQQLSEEDQIASGVSPDLIRLSVGLEDVCDLKKDIRRAFQKIYQ